MALSSLKKVIFLYILKQKLIRYQYRKYTLKTLSPNGYKKVLLKKKFSPNKVQKGYQCYKISGRVQKSILFLTFS